MEDAVHAIIMGFSVLVFVIGLTIAMYMFSLITTTSENLLYYADETNFYDNIEVDGEQLQERQVDVDTVISTLYRYYKENFCVKICDDEGNLMQIFDVNLEGKVRKAVATTTGRTAEQQALVETYNKKDNTNNLFEAPWIGSTDTDIKTRIDYYVNGKSGYINNTYVDYTNNYFYKIRVNNRTASDDKIYFKENFICYSYTGETMTNDDGDILTTGAEAKDKIVIVYTATSNP